MYKTIVIPSNKEMINNISSDAILLGIKDLSVNMPFYITLDELKKIKTKNYKIYVAVHTDTQCKRIKKIYKNDKNIYCIKLDVTDKEDIKKLHQVEKIFIRQMDYDKQKKLMHGWKEAIQATLKFKHK